ncbi:hypothetical protein R6Z07F_010680 [Ovis aries]
MLAGVWVSNRAGSGCDSSGSSRSRLLSSTGGRSRAPGSARRSAGHGFRLLRPEAPVEEMTVRDPAPDLLQRLNLCGARTCWRRGSFSL